jgi:glycine/D-amino acid oxidase-like deaminating enzyme
MEHETPTAVPLDVLVVGGGVAGLWVLDRLVSRGFAAALVEQGALGGGQTVASQGMIHGGIKYALGGRLTRASEAIATMPARWRACAEGHGEVDLTGARRLSDHYWMWSNGSVGSRLSTLLASRVLRGRVARVPRGEFPPFFDDPGFDGHLYRLADFVFDTRSLLETLAAPHRERMLRVDDVAARLARRAGGVVLDAGDVRLRARRVVLTAGAGNEALLAALGADAPRMQRRPLHQVCVDVAHPHPVYAHCITGIRRPEPRMTVTSHPVAGAPGRWTWYLGGAIASDGVERDHDTQVAFAREELDALLPWVDLSDARITTLRVDRAEPVAPRGGRPDEAYVHAEGPVVTAWPTKLSLAPHLGDRVLEALGAPDDAPRRDAALREALAGAERPEVAPGFETLAA